MDSKAKDLNWLSDYLSLYRKPLFETDVRSELMDLRDWMTKANALGKKTIFLGNGGSAAMASHCAVDFTKNARLRAINFNEADLLTCYGNDYGYEEAYGKMVEHYGDRGDVLVAISSSGKSKNILRAVSQAKSMGIKVATFSGFGNGNPLSLTGDLNLVVESRAYNVIEMVHHIWILAVCDLAIGEAEYPASPSP